MTLGNTLDSWALCPPPIPTSSPRFRSMIPSRSARDRWHGSQSRDLVAFSRRLDPEQHGPDPGRFIRLSVINRSHRPVPALRRQARGVLISPLSDPDAVRRSSFPPPFPLPRFPRHPIAEAVLDVGTGGGLPGLPLAICCPGVFFTLIDGTGKKIVAVADMARRLGLDNVRALHVRAEDVSAATLPRERSARARPPATPVPGSGPRSKPRDEPSQRDPGRTRQRDALTPVVVATRTARRRVHARGLGGHARIPVGDFARSGGGRERASCS